MDPKAELATIVAELQKRANARFLQFFPDGGVYRRELYPKHLEFFAAGRTFKERLFMAANRVGKSEAGAFEVTCHLTGDYPPWWIGRRFEHPVEVWASGTNSQTTRDIVQAKLLGSVQQPGTGMIPPHCIVSTTAARGGLAGAIETAVIRHLSGGQSILGLKTYEQGRQSFEGTAKHVIWDDEEPPQDVYTEQLLRTMTTKGITLVTFTPLQGMSEVVIGFLEVSDEAKAFKWWIQAGWKDVPHLDASEKTSLRATMPAYQMKARTEGEPVLGAGAIYPIAEEDLLVPTRSIPDTWRRAYALDIGWNRTAVLWGAEDPGTGAIEFYSEHYQGQGEPASHAEAVKARGEWMLGVIDPAAQGTQNDGKTMMQVYGGLGLNLSPANNAVEAGITDVWNLMVSGRLKVQEHLHNWRSEFRKYHRDEKGKIVKANDHLMDAMKYFVLSGRGVLSLPPKPLGFSGFSMPQGPQAWLGA